MTEPKLLTEAELRVALDENGYAPDLREDIIAAVSLVGLIATEPVDPLLKEVDLLVESIEKGPAINYRDFTLAALKRGMELAPRVELTREMARDAWCNAHGIHKSAKVSEDFVTRLHAALQEQLKEAGRG